ncbi:MAG: T9SS type A sorting domain-containing protein, partial [Bacteroidota bacterium]|nr:T9SS type A sorting domain-containing protein [Bacteroidota bacterium]
GTVTFNGSTADQSIGGNNSSTFCNLTINNTGYNINLNTPVTVTGDLTLTDGNIILNTANLTLGTASADLSNLTGGSSASYIEADNSGTVIYYHNNASTDYTYPVGCASYYTPFTFNTGTSVLGANAYTTMRVVDAAHTEIGTQTNYLSRYWVLTDNDITSPNYNVSYTYDNTDINGTETTLLPYKYASSAWTNGGLLNVNSNTLSWNNITSFSDFTGLGSTPLPIELLSFTAKCTGDNITINWTTANETNNDYFILEKSRDMTDFVEIARIEGQGFSNTNIEYIYNDTLVFSGYNYYRLTQVDFDGTTKSFAPIYVNCEHSNNGEARIFVYPNPFRSEINIFMENINNDVIRFELYDEPGKLLYSEKYKITGSPETHTIKLDQLEPAIYFLKSVTDSLLFTRKIIKKK